MKDVFGKGLYNYWKGDRKSPHVIRRDDDTRDACNFKTYFSKKLSAEEKKIVHFAKGKILDVGCGAGKHILYFQKRGFSVTGIDYSPYAIKVCQERGCFDVEHMDIFSHKLNQSSFDTITLFGNNIGIAGTISKMENLLLILRELAAANACLLLTSLDVTQTKNITHKKYQQENQKAGRYVGEINILRHSRRF